MLECRRIYILVFRIGMPLGSVSPFLN